MIGHLRGTVLDVDDDLVALDVAGVGYDVHVPLPLAARLRIDDETHLFTHLSINQDSHVLYGFESREVRSVFRLLLKVSGVGDRSALAVLSTLTVDEFGQAIRTRDVSAFRKVKGIGPKTASRIAMELQDRVDTVEAASAATAESRGSEMSEAVLALESLGIPQVTANDLVTAAWYEGISTEKLITEAIKRWSLHR